jgi:putative hydrolase of the HAD superfamily
MIVFDLDDTLYLERDFAYSGFRALDDVVMSRFGVPGFGPHCRALFDSGERRQIFDGACGILGIPVSPPLIQDLVDAYRSHLPDISLCADSERWLERNRGVQGLGLITDGPEAMQRNKVRALRLDRWIDHILPTASLGPGHDKPHPRAFETMQSLARPAAQLVYVADNPAKDFIAPRRLGWFTIQIIRDGSVHDPTPKDGSHAADARVTSFDQLDEVLGRRGLWSGTRTDVQQNR